MLSRVWIFLVALTLCAASARAQFDFDVAESAQGRAYGVGSRVTVTVTQPGPVQEVIVRLRDALGRVVDARTLKADRQRRRVVAEFALETFSTHRMYVDVRVGNVTRTRAVWVSHPVDLWLTYQPILQTGQLPKDGPWYDAVRSLGVRTLLAGRHEDVLAALNNGMYVIPSNLAAEVRLALPEKLWEEYVAEWGKALAAGKPYRPERQPSYLDPKVRDAVRTVVGKRAFADSFPLGYILTPDLSYTRRIRQIDLDYSTPALKAYRRWLENRYGSIVKLNRAWGTDFRRFDDVMPMTTDEIRTREFTASSKRPSDYRMNFRPLSDNLVFADRAVLEMFSLANTALQGVDRRGMLGCPSIVLPAPFGGHDIWKLTGEMRLFMPPETGPAGPMIESFLAQRGLRMPIVSRLSSIDELTETRLWSRLLHGDRGLVIPTGVQLLNAEGAPTEQGLALKEILDRIRQGMGYFLAANTFDRVAPRVALYHSRPSLRMMWVLDTAALGSRWRGQAIGEYLQTSTYLQNLQAWAGVLDKVGVPFHYVSSDRMIEEPLNRQEFDVLILPKTLALSDVEIERIEQFASAGGVVIADSCPGRYDENMVERQRLTADRFFGVEHDNRRMQEVAGRLVPVKDLVTERDRNAPDREPYNLLKEIDPSGFKAVEPGLNASRGGTRTLAASVDKARRVPMLALRRHGRGWSVYMNLSVIDAAVGPKVAGMEDPFVPLVTRLLAVGGVRPATGVTMADGAPVARIERIRFRKREADMLIVAGRPETTGDAELIRAFGKQDLNIRMPRANHVYSVLEGAYLGNKAEVTASFTYRQPLVLVGLPYKVKAVRVDNLAVERYTLNFDVLLDTESGAMASEAHVVDLKVIDPKGNEVQFYRTNLPVVGGRLRTSLVMSRSDTELPGEWTLRLRELFSGKRTEAIFELKK